MRKEFKYFILSFTIFFLSACSNKKELKLDIKLSEEKEKTAIILEEDSQTKNTLQKKEELENIKVMVIQCSNGYEYGMHGYNFNPLLERELSKFQNINVAPFPLKKLMGVSYQGVFDKKYCVPIIEKVDVDFLIMTQFTGSPFSLEPKERTWGYQTRILNTKTMQQINSILI